MTWLDWILPWEFSPLVLGASVAAGAAFARGSAVAGVPAFRRSLFWSGFAMLYAALHSGLDYYAEHAFLIHRAQHVLLHHLGPFLIALGRPGEAVVVGTPVRLRLAIIRLLRHRAVASGIDFLNHPVVAVLCFAGLILLWLLPPVHFVAMIDARMYRLMNLSMAINGLMFWNVILNRFCLRPVAASLGARLLMALAVIPPQIAIGALIFLSPREIYPVYRICGRVLGGLSPLAEQQLGGIVLWVSGAMMGIAGFIAIIATEGRSKASASPALPAAMPPATR